MVTGQMGAAPAFLTVVPIVMGMPLYLVGRPHFLTGLFVMPMFPVLVPKKRMGRTIVVMIVPLTVPGHIAQRVHLREMRNKGVFMRANVGTDTAITAPNTVVNSLFAGCNARQNNNPPGFPRQARGH